MDSSEESTLPTTPTPPPPAPPRDPEKAGTSRTAWYLLGLGFVVLWVAYLAFFGPSADEIGRLPVPDLSPTPHKIQANYDWKLEDVDGKPVRFSDYQNMPVVLNIWATWCPPCRAEMPALATLASNPDLKARGVKFLCVATDEFVDDVRNYVAGKPWDMTVLHATELPAEFRSEGIPATFLIAPDGQVVASTLGAARWNDPSVVEFLTKLATGTR